MSDTATTDSSAARLRSFVERIERMEGEKADISTDIKDIYTEVKSAGFDTKVMRQIIRVRKMDAQTRREHEELMDVYQRALGMLV